MRVTNCAINQKEKSYEKKETHGLETYGGICDGAYADGRRLDISRCCWIAADRCQTVTEAVIQEEDAMEAALATEQTETESETDSESAENDSGQTENSEASEIPETSEASETEKTVEETENVNDTEAVDDTEVMETETEEESEEEIEEETEEETEEEELAAIDKPSKVINVRGKDDGSIITTASGRQLRYAYVNRFQNGVIAAVRILMDL